MCELADRFAEGLDPVEADASALPGVSCAGAIFLGLDAVSGVPGLMLGLPLGAALGLTGVVWAASCGGDWPRALWSVFEEG